MELASKVFLMVLEALLFEVKLGLKNTISRLKQALHFIAELCYKHRISLHTRAHKEFLRREFNLKFSFTFAWFQFIHSMDLIFPVGEEEKFGCFYPTKLGQLA